MELQTDTAGSRRLSKVSIAESVHVRAEDESDIETKRLSIERQTKSAKHRADRWRFVSTISKKSRGTMNGRHICRQVKATSSGGSSEDLSELEESQQTNIHTQADGRTSELEFYDLENDNDDVEVDYDASHITDLSVRVYGRACEALNIPLCSYFAKHLLTSQLKLKRHILGVIGAKACAIALVTNTIVTHLDLTGNDIGDKGTNYISEMLYENLYITDLTLAENSITSRGLKNLCEVLKVNRQVRRLDISGNNFRECDAEYLADLINNNKLIHTLILHHNCFREEGGETLSQAILNNNTLKVLDLSWNHLRRKGAIAICEAIENNASIETLLVSWNGFYQEGCMAMRKALCMNQTLRHLDLTCNRISKDCLVIFLDGLKRNTSLESLQLDKNPITSEGAKLLVDMLKEAEGSGLKYINIESQSVDQRFIAGLEEMKENGRHIVIKHGVVFEHNDIHEEEDMYLDEDPMMVLMEFMRQKNMRLVDLFTSLDADGSKSLTRDEFRDGLIAVNIPLTSNSLDKMIDKLDLDGDGEVDFGELMEGQREYKKKLMRIQKQTKEAPADLLGNPPENEMQRIASKLKKLLAFKKAAEKQAEDEGGENDKGLSRRKSMAPSDSGKG